MSYQSSPGATGGSAWAVVRRAGSRGANLDATTVVLDEPQWVSLVQRLETFRIWERSPVPAVLDGPVVQVSLRVGARARTFCSSYSESMADLGEHLRGLVASREPLVGPVRSTWPEEWGGVGRQTAFHCAAGRQRLRFNERCSNALGDPPVVAYSFSVDGSFEKASYRTGGALSWAAKFGASMWGAQETPSCDAAAWLDISCSR